MVGYMLNSSCNGQQVDFSHWQYHLVILADWEYTYPVPSFPGDPPCARDAQPVAASPPAHHTQRFSFARSRVPQGGRLWRGLWCCAAGCGCALLPWQTGSFGLTRTTPGPTSLKSRQVAQIDLATARSIFIRYCTQCSNWEYRILMIFWTHQSDTQFLGLRLSYGGSIVSISATIGRVIHLYWCICAPYISDLVQDWSISIANALEILQSCTKPLYVFSCNREKFESNILAMQFVYSFRQV